MAKKHAHKVFIEKVTKVYDGLAICPECEKYVEFSSDMEYFHHRCDKCKKMFIIEINSDSYGM